MEVVREERIKERAQEDQALKSADIAKKESYVWKDDEEVRFNIPSLPLRLPVVRPECSHSDMTA
jgi:hypothetical protein